jgi:trehalose 6-phosphate synthase/phosphatase
MQKRLQRYNVRRWAHDFVDRLCHVKKMQEVMETKRFTEYARGELLNDYRKSRTRLLFLDYDGTLVPFAERPQKAEPQDLLKLLKEVARPSKNEVVIISGRDKETLQQWFGFLPLSLVAEHGVWIKEKGKDWEMAEHLSNEWKQEIRPLLEVYVDRTPGSFIEEKEFSLVWHYRKADPELASLRARELKNALLHLCANLNLGVLEGAKVVEIKSANVNKGRAALRWLAKREWEFIMAAGDDWTDEDIFNVLPQRAYSLKVGFAPSKAKFNLENVEEIKSLLQLLSTIS